MTRKLLLVMITLAIVGAAFELHRRIAGTGLGIEVVTPPRPDDVVIPQGRGMSIGQTEVQVLRQFRMKVPDKGSVRVLEVSDFTPRSDREGKMRHFLFHSRNRNGTVGALMADYAEVSGRNMDSQNPDIQEGTLIGNVEIRYDRFGDTSLEEVAVAGVARPMMTEPEKHPLKGTQIDDLVIRAEKLRFFEGGKRVLIDGPMTVLSREFYLSGTNMQMIWTQIGQDVQSFYLEKGDRLIWYDGDNRLKGFTTDDSKTVAAGPAAPAPALTDEERAERKAKRLKLKAEMEKELKENPKKEEPKEDKKEQPKEEPKEEPKKSDAKKDEAKTDPKDDAKKDADPKSKTAIAAAPASPQDLRSYHVTFKRNVVVNAPGNSLKVYATGPDGRLTLDIDLLSRGSFLDSENPPAGSPTAAPPRPSARAGRDEMPKKPEAAPVPAPRKVKPKGKPVEITWQGPMEVVGQPPDRTPGAKETRRTRVLAEGNPVLVENESGAVRGSSMLADGVERWAVFESAHQPVRLTYKDGSVVTGTQLILRPITVDKQTAEIIGPGTIRSKMEDAFGGGVRNRPADPRFPDTPGNPFLVKRENPITGTFRDRLVAELRWFDREGKKQPVPVRFRLFEDVVLHSDEWHVEGMEAVMNFTSAEKWTDGNKPVPSHVEIRRNVLARRGDDVLLAEHIELPVEQDENGRLFFKRLVATGKVRGRQQGQEIWAQDSLTVEVARRDAVAQPNTNASNAKYVPERFKAVGNVHIRDTARGLDARGREVWGSTVADAAILFGSPEHPATAIQKRGDKQTVIQSPDKIVMRRMNQQALQAEIFGKGTIVAPVDRSFDGKAGDQGGTMTLTWKKEMLYLEDPSAKPPVGIAVAKGDVLAFIRRPGTNGSALEEQVSGQKLSVFLELPVKTDSKLPDTNPVSQRDLPTLPDEGMGGRRVRQILIEEEVEVLSTETSPDGSRRTFVLNAPKDVKYDMFQQRLAIIGKGELGIEEISPLSAVDKQGVAALVKDNAGRQVMKETVGGFRWSEKLEWRKPESRMELAGDVKLVNRGTDSLMKQGVGTAVPLAGTNPAPTSVVVTTLECAKLDVDLADNKPAQAGAKPDAGSPIDVRSKGFTQIKRFQAAGDVKYKEGDLNVSSQTLIFERQAGDIETLFIKGVPGKPAEVLEINPDGLYRPMRGDYIVGRRDKAGDFYFRIQGATGSTTGGK